MANKKGPAVVLVSDNKKLAPRTADEVYQHRLAYMRACIETMSRLMRLDPRLREELNPKPLRQDGPDAA